MKILVAVDFSLHGQAQVQFLKAVPYLGNAEVRVLHIIEPLTWELQMGYPATMPLPQAIIDERRTNAMRLVENVAESLRSNCHLKNVQTNVLEGNVREEIIRCADALDADMIIVGSHGREGLMRVLMGSVSESVANRSKRSVLVAKLPQDEAGRARVSQAPGKLNGH